MRKHENNQHALVPPKTESNVAEELKTVAYANPPIEERMRRKKKL